MEAEPLNPRQIRIADTMHSDAVAYARTKGLNFSAYVRSLIAADLEKPKANEIRR